jgi:hypothetical protein
MFSSSTKELASSGALACQGAQPEMDLHGSTEGSASSGALACIEAYIIENPGAWSRDPENPLSEPCRGAPPRQIRTQPEQKRD